MPSSEFGPSWLECLTLSHTIVDRRGVAPDVHMVGGVKRLDGRGLASWCFVATSAPRHGEPGRTYSAQASFGPGADFKTAPAALYSCLYRILQRMDEVEDTAAQQAGF